MNVDYLYNLQVCVESVKLKDIENSNIMITVSYLSKSLANKVYT